MEARWFSAVELRFPHFGRPTLKEILPTTIFLCGLRDGECWSSNEESLAYPFKLHKKCSSQSCVSLHDAQKVFGAQCTFRERSAQKRVQSAVRHTRANAVH